MDAYSYIVILRFDDANLSRHNDGVWQHQIVIFIQVVTDAYPCCETSYIEDFVELENKSVIYIFTTSSAWPVNIIDI